jgi:hypothetical protein
MSSSIIVYTGKKCSRGTYRHQPLREREPTPVLVLDLKTLSTLFSMTPCGLYSGVTAYGTTVLCGRH